MLLIGNPSPNLQVRLEKNLAIQKELDAWPGREECVESRTTGICQIEAMPPPNESDASVSPWLSPLSRMVRKRECVTPQKLHCIAFSPAGSGDLGVHLELKGDSAEFEGAMWLGNCVGQR